MQEFRHLEYCMGTAFQYWGRSELDDADVKKAIAESVAILHHADEVFSLYKEDSPLSRLARGETSIAELPSEVEYIWDECEKWEKVTEGWFSAMTPANTFDPSGLVKSWAAQKAADRMIELGVTDFAINAGGDILLSKNVSSGKPKRIGVGKPVSIASKDSGALVVLDLNETDFYAVATSGTTERGEHIWNPKAGRQNANQLLQVTVVARDIITADVFATAAFAAGNQADAFLDRHLDKLEAMLIDLNGDVYATKGFSQLVSPV